VGGAGTAGQAGTAGTAGTAGQAGTAGTAGQAGITPPRNPQANNFNNNFNNFGVGRRPFFADPNVRRQLNLNDNQFNRLNQSYLDAIGNFNQGVTGLQNNLTEEQRAQQLMQLQNRFNQDMSRSIDTTFADPQLRNRFGQLSTQFQGAAAFNDPMIRQRLNLTAEQQRQFSRLSNEWRQQLQRLRRAGNDADPQVSQQQFQQLQQQFQQQMLGVLNPQQQQTWNQIVGTPFAFPQDVFFDDAPPTNPLDRTQRGVPLVPATPGGTAQQGTATQGGGQVPANTSQGGTAQGTQTQGTVR
jgi:hypothetical protein